MLAGALVFAALALLVRGCAYDSGLATDQIDRFDALEDLTAERSQGRQLLQVGKAYNDWVRLHGKGPLAPRPEGSGPDGFEWTNSIALCTIVKGENATDMREWILYNKWLGVDHIYLTENAQKIPSYTLAQVQPFIDEGFLTYDTEPTVSPQLKVLRRCISEHYLEYDWLGNIDVDEFLVLRRKGETLKEMLDDFKHEAGLSVRWVLFGSGGRMIRPPSGGVLQHYRTCSAHGEHLLKTFANTHFLQNIANHPHNFEFRDDMVSVDENHDDVPFWLDKSPMCMPPRRRASKWRVSMERVLFQPAEPECFQVPAPFTKATSVDRVALFHYNTKSAQDFCAKMQRGSATDPQFSKGWGWFVNQNANADQAGGICEEAVPLGTACCPPWQLLLPAHWNHSLQAWKLNGTRAQQRQSR